MIITLASSKGGVGKSTLTGCLAGVWAASGHTVHIVDLDSNRTITRWFGDEDQRPRGLSVAAPDPADLTAHLESTIADTDPDLVLIDVAGAYERALTLSAARAHLTLIPASPTEADIYEAGRIARHIAAAFAAMGREPLYRLVLNRVPSLASGAQLFAITELIRLKLPRIRTRIMQRAAYEEMGLSGLPPHFADRKRPTVAKACQELDALRADIEGLFGNRSAAHLENGVAA